MDLFTEYGSNLLPYDGEVNYYGRIVRDADRYFDLLMRDVPWEHDRVFINGEVRNTRRKVAWYGDDGFLYAYSGVTRRAIPWIEPLVQIRGMAERYVQTAFNSCLANLYADGTEGMSWHSDDEAELGQDTVIASVSLGAERRFLLRHKRTKETVQVILEHGSLLVMKGATQTHWMHSVPAAARVMKPRVNLTFRTFVG